MPGSGRFLPSQMTNTAEITSSLMERPSVPLLSTPPPATRAEASRAPVTPTGSTLGPAVAITGAYFGAPSTLSVLVGVTLGAVSGVRAALDGRTLDVLSVQMGTLAPSLALSMVFGPGALVALLLLWSHRLPPFSGPSGLGFVAPSRVSVLLGLLIGVSMATLSILVSPLLSPTPTPESLGLLAVAVSKPGVTRTLWCVFALAIAPVTEEVLFRGVLFAGLRERLSPLATASAVTVVFTAVHVTAYWRYWPALLFVFLLGLCLAAIRLRYASLGPAVAMHFAFNAIAVAAVLID